MVNVCEELFVFAQPKFQRCGFPMSADLNFLTGSVRRLELPNAEHGYRKHSCGVMNLQQLDWLRLLQITNTRMVKESKVCW